MDGEDQTKRRSPWIVIVTLLAVAAVVAAVAAWNRSERFGDASVVVCRYAFCFCLVSVRLVTSRQREWLTSRFRASRTNSHSELAHPKTKKKQNCKTKNPLAQTHSFVESNPSDLKDVVGRKTQGEQQLETVTKDVGEMESNLDGSEILSDGGATEEDQIAMDAAEDDDEDGDEKRV